MEQIALFNVTNDSKYFPQRRDIFNEARWNEAKHLNFNSIKVRLEQMGDNTTAALVSAFQFHKGTIRTTVFQFRHRPMSISIP